MDMQVDEDGAKHVFRGHDVKLGGSSATEFGTEITNTNSDGNSALGRNPAPESSPRLFKRMFVDVEEGNLDQGDEGDGVEIVKTPIKKMKFSGLGDESDMASEDEVEVVVWGELPSAPMKDKKATVSS